MIRRVNRRDWMLRIGSGLLAAAIKATPGVAQSVNAAARVGVLGVSTSANVAPLLVALRQGMRERGHEEGKTYTLDVQLAEGYEDRMPQLAGNLVSRRPSVIVTASTSATVAARGATNDIPIVMATSDDPVGMGFVQSLARPGGRITGNSLLSTEVFAKWVDLARDLVPRNTRVAVLASSNPTHQQMWGTTPELSRKLKMHFTRVYAPKPEDIRGALAQAVKSRSAVLIVLPDAMFASQRYVLAQLTAQLKLPAIYSWAEYVNAGGLASYGASVADLFRRAATYVDKILKGTNPAELPVEQPTKFDLVLNLKTAKAMGITFPQSILLRADRVIE